MTKLSQYRYNPASKPLPCSTVSQQCVISEQPTATLKQLASGGIYFPRTTAERAKFRTKNNKKVPPHHWDVYDYIMNIPAGKVSTYRCVSMAIGGSPRSVGGALRHNPFDPYVPCHRVIASNLFMGGFSGEWGQNSKTGTQCDRKLTLLDKEGVYFTKAGYLEDPKSTLWKP